MGVHICTVLGFGIHFSPPTKMNARRPVSVNGATDILEGVLKRKAAQEGTTLEQQHKLRKAIYEKVKRTVKATAAVDEERRVALMDKFDLKSMSTSFIKEVLNQHPTLLESLKACILTLDLSQVIVKKRKVKDERGDTNVDEDTATFAGAGADAAPAEDNDTAPPPAKKPKTSPTAFGDAMDSETPDEYQCPITMEVMNNPVIAADGFTYEKKDIEEWFRKKTPPILSPKTGEELDHLRLTPNHALKALIRDHLERRAGASGSSSA